MNVAIVGGLLPYPANSGSRLRMYHLAARLAARHCLTYIAARGASAEALAHFADLGIKVVEVEHTVPPKSGVAFYARLAVNLASPVPYAAASFQGPALARAVAQIASRHPIDLWQAEWVAGVAACRLVAGRRLVVMAQNVETLLWERYAEHDSNPARRWFVRQQARKFARFERSAFQQAGRVVTVSEDDAALVRDRFAMPRVDVVDNGIDRAAFENIRPDRDPSRLLFLGSLDWRPNLDGLDHFLSDIYPAVRAAEPEVTFDVVGRNPPLALRRRLETTPGTTLHADVADVRPFLARSGVMVVPLRIGGGSRLKILEALATALPVISTRVGAEGLALRHGREIEIVEGPADFALALVRAVREPARVQALAARGRRRVFARYDWDHLAAALERSWERCLAGEAVPA